MTRYFFLFFHPAVGKELVVISLPARRRTSPLTLYTRKRFELATLPNLLIVVTLFRAVLVIYRGRRLGFRELEGVLGFIPGGSLEPVQFAETVESVFGSFEENSPPISHRAAENVRGKKIKPPPQPELIKPRSGYAEFQDNLLLLCEGLQAD